MSTSDDGVTSPTIVWDLTEPTAPSDLGSKVERFVEADGPATIDVVFPSGRTISGTFDRGGVAEAGTRGVINLVSLLAVVSSPDDLRREIEKFVQEWGPVDAEIERFVEEYNSAFSANGSVRPADVGGISAGNSVRQFEAAESDGVSPSLGVRVSATGVTLRWSLRFDPNG